MTRNPALAIIGALLLVLGWAAGPNSPLEAPRIVLGLLYVLFVPGYFLTKVIFPGPSRIDSVERLGLSFALSLALVAVLALVLDRTVGLRPGSALLAQLLVTLGLIVLAARVRVPVDRSAAMVGMSPGQVASVRLGRFRPMLLLGPAMLLAGVVLLIALVPATPGVSPERETEFFMTGKGGLLRDYPYVAERGSTIRIPAGVTNRGRSDGAYRIEVWSDAAQLGGGRQVLETPLFVVPAGSTAERTLAWAVAEVGPASFDVLLYAGTERVPLRRLSLRVDVGA